MAKIRVYELARDLNLTNKMLLGKLDDMDISVKSHMSSLDDEAVARIKTTIFGTTKKEETVEETRIRPTVIRRRRKKVKVTVAPEPPAVPDDVAAVEKPAEDADEDKGAEKEAAAVEKPLESADEITAEEAVPAEEKPEDIAAAAGEADKPADLKEKKTKKTIKKGKAAESAKIIQLPLKPVEKPSKKKAAPGDKTKIGKFPPRKPADKRPAAAPADLKTADAKKKKWKQKGEEGDRQKKFVKKKISFRKKSVVEGQDLYDRGYKSRKPRKGAKARVSASAQKTQITTAKAIKRRIKVDEAILISDLAKRMGLKANEIIQTLIGMGVMVTVNQSIDLDTASVSSCSCSLP